MDYPVNTLFDPDSGQVTYRIEWAYMRADVGEREMVRRFDSGTRFRVSGIELKDDRLELKLEGGSGGSARLKLMLGRGWQSKLDVSSVQAQLARVFVLDQYAEPPHDHAVASDSRQAASGAAPASTNEYRPAPNVPRIEGRISADDLRAVMASFDEEVRNALSNLSQDAALLSRSLLAYQKVKKEDLWRYPDIRDPQLQAISALQDRLGKSLQPQRDDDVIQMNEVFKRCLQVSQVGQARDEHGNLYGAGRNSGDFQRLLLSDSAIALARRVPMDVQAERAQRAVIDQARTAVISIEQSLDGGNLQGANQQYQQLLSDPQTAQQAPVQLYLQRTDNFRQDLVSYTQANQLVRHYNLSAAQELQHLAQELDLLRASESKPLTKKVLQDAISADAGVAKQKLASLPSPQVDESAYRLPPGFSSQDSTNLNEKLALVASRIAALDKQLASASELREVAAQGTSIKTASDALGAGTIAGLNEKLERIESLERLRASLADTQNSLQARIAAEREAEQRRIAEAQAEAERKAAAAIAERQVYAETLTKRMSGEIRWRATGKENEILAGCIVASRVSDSTYSQLGATSPLWKEFYSKRFKYRGILDRDRTLKVAVIKAEGGFAISLADMPYDDQSYLQHTIDVLVTGAAD
jgi:hypothetical protein